MESNFFMITHLHTGQTLVHGYISQSGTRVYLSIWYTGISPNLVSLPIWYIPNLVHGYISQSGARVYLPIWYISQSGARVYLPVLYICPVWYISPNLVYIPIWYAGISPNLVYLPVWCTGIFPSLVHGYISQSGISPSLVHGYISQSGTRVYFPTLVHGYISKGKPSNLSHAGSVQPRILHHVTFCFHVIIKKGIFRTQRHLPLVHPSRSTVLQCQDHTPRETKNRHLNNGCKGQIKRSV